MNQLLLPITAMALALGLQATAQDAPAPKAEGPRPAAPGPRRARLNLTDAQKAAMKEIRAKHQESIQAKAKAAAEARNALAQAMSKADSKPEDLRTLHTNASNLRFELMMEHRAVRQECQAVLTAEQREQAARMEGRWQGRMEALRGRHPGGHFGRGGDGAGFGPEF